MRYLHKPCCDVKCAGYEVRFGKTRNGYEYVVTPRTFLVDQEGHSINMSNPLNIPIKIPLPDGEAPSIHTLDKFNPLVNDALAAQLVASKIMMAGMSDQEIIAQGFAPDLVEVSRDRMKQLKGSKVFNVSEEQDFKKYKAIKEAVTESVTKSLQQDTDGI